MPYIPANTPAPPPTHTTVRSADRPKIIPERNSQSADVSGSSWKVGPSYSLAQAASMQPQPKSPGGPRPGGQPVVARALAPNGQPRKVPVSMLSQYHQLAPNGRPASISTSSGLTTPEHSRIKSVAQLRYGLHSK